MKTFTEQYAELIESARVWPSKLPGQKHHVIPRSIHDLTPSTVAKHQPRVQVVFLSHQQHLMAHWLLFRIHEHGFFGEKMAHALTWMSGLGRGGSAGGTILASQLQSSLMILLGQENWLGSLPKGGRHLSRVY